ncbi:MAG: TIGR03986 family CRISPR-associated RAMP protein [Alkalinema sp. RU_4_3]|nr:TIGR03986 family CRISPR-associated RAMP protein [Alkalinema sp. RU_4_3]
MEINGYVCITNPNIDRKHDERVFFDTSDEPIMDDLTPELKQQWNQLIANYQQEHKSEICDKHRTSPPALTHSSWSRHITHGHHQLAEGEKNLAEGTLCYALVDNSNSDPEVIGLYPVMISRELFNYAPSNLLDTSLHPANELKFLSPGDRVFGWVHQNDKNDPLNNDQVSAYKGQLRIHSVRCISPDPVESFGKDGFPLAILGQPKPQQTRFYAAKNQQGEAFGDNTSKDKGYQDQSQGLRGRKVYPHQKDLPDAHWKNPKQDRTQQLINGHYQEYRRPKKNGEEQRDDQNRSIRAWVKPEQEFTFSIDVTNLSDIELGALLYLLNSEHYHRLGSGKSLGFGSVKLELDESSTDLRKGQAWGEFYLSLLPISPLQAANWQSAVQEFEKAIVDSYGKPFKKVPFIAAFQQATLGYSGPVHYPRVTLHPKSDGESFKWFVENDAQPRGQKLALPDLASKRILPIDPTNEQNRPPARR